MKCPVNFCNRTMAAGVALPTLWTVDMIANMKSGDDIFASGDIHE